MDGFGDEQHTTDWSFDGVRQPPLFRKCVQYIILERVLLKNIVQYKNVFMKL